MPKINWVALICFASGLIAGVRINDLLVSSIAAGVAGAFLLDWPKLKENKP